MDRADKDVAASWQNVMTPPTSGTASNNQRRGLTAAVAAAAGEATAVPAVAPRCETASIDAASNSEAATPVTSTRPCLAAGDGLTETDAADLNYILEEVGDSIRGGIAGENTSPSQISLSGSGPGKANISDCARSMAVDKTHSSQAAYLGSAGDSAGKGSSSERAGAASSSVESVALSTSSSVQSSVAGESCCEYHHGTAVPGSTPLRVEPGPAARKALRTLRMYVHRLRVTKDHEDSTVE